MGNDLFGERYEGRREKVGGGYIREQWRIPGAVVAGRQLKPVQGLEVLGRPHVDVDSQKHKCTAICRLGRFVLSLSILRYHNSLALSSILYVRFGPRDNFPTTKTLLFSELLILARNKSVISHHKWPAIH